MLSVLDTFFYRDNNLLRIDEFMIYAHNELNET